MRSRGTSGARVAENLLTSQRAQLGLLLSRLIAAMETEQARTADEANLDDEKPRRRDDKPHPYNVFCIDGGRGAGKTYCLLTLERILKAIVKRSDEQPIEKDWKDLEADGLWTRIKSLQTAYVQKDQVLLQTMKVIFPGDMERQELVLEAIFADIRRDLEARAEKNRGNESGEKWGQLRTRLINEIGTPWSFARRVGLDAVTRNSIGYDDMFCRIDDLNMAAANRVPAWRDFLDDYLDARGIAFQVILLDDSDSQPELTYDILHTARTVLNHPRVITVIAGNVKSMRRSLISLAMRDLGPSMAALNERSHPTGEAWRRDERIEIEQRLEKVLPDAHRFYLDRPDLGEDFRKVAQKNFEQACDGALRTRWKGFVRVKMLCALKQEMDKDDLPSPAEAASTQDYLSWWIFRTRYAVLSPSSPRQIETFREYYVDPPSGAAVVARTEPEPETEDEPVARQKRLPVMLFASPENYQLIQRLTDSDHNLIEWVMRQRLESSWVGQRSLSINGRSIPQGSFSYDYLHYRFDVGLAQPIRNNSEAVIPDALLPLVAGRKRMRHFFLPHLMPKRSRKLGVARWLDHSAVPGNCLYFSDLAALPGVFFVDRAIQHEAGGAAHAHQGGSMDRSGLPSAGGDWEADLWAIWPGLIEASEDETMQRYLAQVVFRTLRHAKGVRTSVLVEVLEPLGVVEDRVSYEAFFKSELNLLNDPSFFEKDLPKAREGLEKYVTNWEGIPRPASTKAAEALQNADKAKHLLARYAAMTGDLRRASAAVRIYQNALQQMALSDALLKLSPAHRSMQASIANAERMRLYPLEALIDAVNADEWVKALLGCCQVSKFKAVLAKALKEERVAKADADFIAKLFALIDDPDPPSQAEGAIKWVRGWRRIGRLACDQWRLGGNLESELILCEPLDPFDHRPEMQGRWQSARALTLFLYGIAPSMPALIHADIASRVHRLQQLNNRYKNNKFMIDKIQKCQTDIEESIRRWREFLFSVTAAMRYVRMKSLHVHCALISERAEMYYRDHVEAKGSKKFNDDFKRFTDDLAEMIKSLGSRDSESALNIENVSENCSIWELISKELKARSPDGRGVAYNTRMVPDASPSTLFGDGWITDVVVRLFGHDQSESEEGISYGGIFGEAEHWFWAAHYMLSSTERLLREKQTIPSPQA